MADADETNAPFLQPPLDRAKIDRDTDDTLTTSQAWCLYLSHFLSVWNSRAYEYGAILFIQRAFPGNLLPSSINGIAETVCVLLFASALGRWVDKSRTRLRPLLLTIAINRVTLCACCVLWLWLFDIQGSELRHFIFALILSLGMVEKISRMTNFLSMERDWVPILANSVVDGEGPGSVPFDLTQLNTAMRRIDMGCRAVAPLAVSAIIEAVGPSPAAAMVGCFSVASAVIEFWSAIRVWKQNSRLRVGKPALERREEIPGLGSSSGSRLPLLTRISGIPHAAKGSWDTHLGGLRYYFHSSVWVPSVCVAVFHGSVLTWSGTLITWLLNAGFPLNKVTIAKAVGSAFEFGSTFAFPLGVAYLITSTHDHVGSLEAVERRLSNASDVSDVVAPSPVTARDADEQYSRYSNLQMAVVKVAQVAIGGVFLALIPTIMSLFSLDSLTQSALSTQDEGTTVEPLSRRSTTVAIAFFALLSLTLLGRWTYDLAVTQLTQMLIPATHRSSFGGTEQAITSLVSMVHWVGAAIWHEQEDFKWMALMSFVAVGMATGAHMWWAHRWKRHAHLINLLR